jgi:hypothetical protein
MRPAIIQQFNLGVQYQLDSHTSLQAGYVGQVGQHLAVPMAINQYTEDEPKPCDAACAVQIEPFYALVGEGGTVIETASRAISNYHSLQTTLQRQQSHGLLLQANYTYGKSLTDNPGYFGVDGSSGSDSFWQDVNNPRGDYGPSMFDARNSLSGSAIYDFPFGRGKEWGAKWNRVTDEVFGGWELSGTTTMFSGLPVSITNGQSCGNNCPEQQTQDYAQHANQYRPMKITGRGWVGGVFKWFGTDPSAQPCSARGVDNGTCAYGRAHDAGTARVGTERGPGFTNFDLSLFKSFRTVKNEFVKARIDAFNAFNIASYGQPSNYVGSGSNSTWGSIGGTRSAPRQLQISVVYQF